jgi:hypothetical protein
MEKVGITPAPAGFSKLSSTDFGTIIIFATTKTRITADRNPKIFLYTLPYCDNKFPAAATPSMRPDIGIGTLLTILSIVLTGVKFN